MTAALSIVSSRTHDGPAGEWAITIVLSGKVPLGKAKLSLTERDSLEGSAHDELGHIEGEVVLWRGYHVFETKGPWKGADASNKTPVQEWVHDIAKGTYEWRPVHLQLHVGGRTGFLCRVPLLQDKVEDPALEGTDWEIVAKLEVGGETIESQPTLLNTLRWELPVNAQRCPFPWKGGNVVKLYHDAHASNNGNNCYLDMKKAMEEAKQFIYLVDWSMWPWVRLERNGKGGMTLEELLKKKVKEGVHVAVQIWDETDLAGMGTHENETEDFCKKNGIHIARTSPSLLYFSHHQKNVICDAPDELVDGKRKVVAFVGGLDLTDGRWDTPEHPLFKTHDTLHHKDWYNGEGNAREGKLLDKWPRQPWHDIHAMVDGPAAYDILENFDQRWKAQGKNPGTALYKVSRGLFPRPNAERGKWRVQVFRSINAKSKGTPGDEDAIQQAYLNAIMCSQRFLYIETQYFMGSAYAWDENKKVKVQNHVPYMIAQRIVNMIQLGKPYKVVIVIPMYPEGDPRSNPNAEQRRFQFETMRMMYREIAAALKAAKKKEDVNDYLSFYCLGQTEPDHSSDLDGLLATKHKGYILQLNKRYMIYVHSKMLIADDKYIIVGSANLNERSLNGSRDTEICIGAYESVPDRQSFGGLQTPISPDVHTFRKGLWQEHLGGSADDWADPLAAGTRSKVRDYAKANWKAYLDRDKLPHGHLLPYPLRVTAEGQVHTTGDDGKQLYFPDCGHKGQERVQGETTFYLDSEITG